MSHAIKLPDEITALIKLVKDLVPNSSAAARPALLNTMLMNHHPASCRSANKKTVTPNKNLAV